MRAIFRAHDRFFVCVLVAEKKGSNLIIPNSSF